MADVNGSTEASEMEVEEVPAGPTTVKKLRKLTVTIGPLRQYDLQSQELHRILGINNKFSIDFDLTNIPPGENVTSDVEEKLGFVTIPFEIHSPEFLVTLAHKLGNLYIEGRDMSVALPDEFTQEVEATKKKIEEEKKRAIEARRAEELAKKRFLYMTNLPETVEEETVKSLFPDCISVTDITEGELRFIKLEFLDHEVAQKCLEENKDVEIGEKQVRLSRFNPADRKPNRDKGDRKPYHDRRRGDNRDRRSDRPRMPRRDSYDKPRSLLGGFGGRGSLMNTPSMGGGNYGGNWRGGRGGGGGRFGNKGDYHQSKPAQTNYSQARDYGGHYEGGYSRGNQGGYGGQGKRKSYDDYERVPNKRQYGGGQYSSGGYSGGSRNMGYDSYDGYNRYGGGY